MKRMLQLFVLAVSITAVPAVHAQDQYTDTAQPANTVQPTDFAAVAPVVYETPVVYTGQVIYQAPVVYNAPVVYATTPAVAVDTVRPERDCQPASTVVYIGGGNTRYQESRNNCGSTVTYIGGHR
jgi:hypothetical protein